MFQVKSTVHIKLVLCISIENQEQCLTIINIDNSMEFSDQKNYEQIVFIFYKSFCIQDFLIHLLLLLL